MNLRSQESQLLATLELRSTMRTSDQKSCAELSTSRDTAIQLEERKEEGERFEDRWRSIVEQQMMMRSELQRAQSARRIAEMKHFDLLRKLKCKHLLKPTTSSSSSSHEISANSSKPSERLPVPTLRKSDLTSHILQESYTWSLSRGSFLLSQTERKEDKMEKPSSKRMPTGRIFVSNVTTWKSLCLVPRRRQRTHQRALFQTCGRLNLRCLTNPSKMSHKVQSTRER
jgi:hypothetical protein